MNIVVSHVECWIVATFGLHEQFNKFSILLKAGCLFFAKIIERFYVRKFVRRLFIEKLTLLLCKTISSLNS